MIYSVREWEEAGNRDGSVDKIDLESRMRPWISSLGKFATIKISKNGVITHKPSIRWAYPVVPDPKKLDKFGEGLVYVVRLNYPGAWYSQIYSPRYLFFENNDDLADIIKGAERGREILCGGEINCMDFFKKESREVFRAQLDFDTWARARGWALWKALITLVPLVGKNDLEVQRQKNIIDAILHEHADDVHC